MHESEEKTLRIVFHNNRKRGISMNFEEVAKVYQVHFKNGKNIEFVTELDLEKIVEEGSTSFLWDYNKITLINLCNVTNVERLGKFIGVAA